MLRPAVFAMLAVALNGEVGGGATIAQHAPPSNTEACLQSAVELEQAVDEKMFSSSEIEKIDDMLTAMENRCDDQNFEEAMEIANTIVAIIGANR